MADLLYLDDLAIGGRFGSATKVVDESEITSFAKLFDPQPFHLDREAATNSRFGGLVASGWHTGAMTMRLLVGQTEIPWRLEGAKALPAFCTAAALTGRT